MALRGKDDSWFIAPGSLGTRQAMFSDDDEKSLAPVANIFISCGRVVDAVRTGRPCLGLNVSVSRKPPTQRFPKSRLWMRCGTT